jgi:hypothetical protein
MVSWQEHGAVYWVRNSLSDTVANGEMLAIAEQTKPFAVAASSAGSAPLILKAARIPAGQTVVVKKSDVLKTVGGLGGLVSLAFVPLLAFGLFRRRRDLALARQHLVAGAPMGVHLSSSLAHVPYVPLPPQQPAPMSFDDLEQRRVAQRRAYRRKVVAITLLAVLAVVGAGVAIAQRATSSSSTHRPSRPLSTVPTVSVSVLNASTIPGAARQLADDLHARGVTLATVGNDPESRARGITIMYASGELAQAKRLALLMKGVSPKVAPLDTTTTAAAGYGAKLVVVIG